MNIDISFSSINVMGIRHKICDGHNIGAPLSAGGSALVVAWREHDLLSAQTQLVRESLFHVFAKRWLDDLFLAVNADAPLVVKRLCRALLSKFFYGNSLRSKEVMSNISSWSAV